ncbi:PH domain-containing protein [Streptacidiphilus sp. P02-A3a]|uniref:PH domain-containing protein n=1 Tax=Streptacidiphilus sp. P02-A3a TaxID=2704468 RepID=UPI0015FBB6BF|nr:PH domain-containing protein [Streptacidiphilus sp. P02-A3a]QMU72613.1 PH domain-containing protein [Streptacidiphilus sp. P02-A3a]
MSDPQQQNSPDQEPFGRENPDPAAPAGTGSAAPGFADQVFRSVPSVVAGSVLLLLVGWLCVDAMVVGRGRAPLEGAAALLLLAPLLGAFTVWPCVRANAERLVVRNPFRTITVPWVQVESLQAALSVELRSGGQKYQIWALPVSLRQRKRGNRRAMRELADQGSTGSRRGRFGAGADYPPPGGAGLRTRGAVVPAPGSGNPNRAWADNVVDQLNELREQAGAPVAGAAAVRWSWWVVAPAVVGAIGLVILLAA